MTLHLNKQRFLKSRIFYSIVLLVVFVGCILYFNQSMFSLSGKNAGGFSYALAYVENVPKNEIIQNANDVQGLYGGAQVATVRILTGRYIGNVVSASNILTTEEQVVAHTGQILVVDITSKADGSGTVTVDNYFRLPFWGLLVLGVIALLLWIGKKKGLFSLVALGFNLICVLFIFIPMVFHGYDPLLSALLVTLLSSCATFVLLSGWSSKTVSAWVGTMSGVCISAAIASLSDLLTHLNGFSLSDSDSLIVIAQKTHLHLESLLFAGVLIASFGAVMDISMSIASAVDELYRLNPSLTMRGLFSSGIRVGQDMMGTMINTLLLAFAGSSISVLLLLYSYLVPLSNSTVSAQQYPEVLSKTSQVPLMQLLNSNLVGVEILQGVIGAAAIVLTVPIVAWACAVFIPFFAQKSQKAAD